MLTVVQKKYFDQENQIRFANLSGDYNPMHIDTVKARRYLFGFQVVHGMHSALWAMNQYFSTIEANSINIVSLQAKFLKPLGLDIPVVIKEELVGLNKVLIKLVGEGKVPTIFMSLKIQWNTENQEPNNNDFNSNKFNQKPITLEKDQVKDNEGEVDILMNNSIFKDMFPTLFSKCNTYQISFLATTTRLVGMICPGLNSVYSALKVSFLNSEILDKKLNYKVKSFDERFSRLKIGLLSSNYSGEIKSFVRPSLNTFPSIKRFVAFVNPEEFPNVKALIIGGSRGLGEVCAKLLGAGGAEVLLTYYAGREDAEVIAAEINSLGKKTATALQLDVLKLNQAAKDKIEAFKPTHLFYLATPYIGKSEEGDFQQLKFEDFCSYYINGFHNVFKGVCKNVSFVFYPSTIYVESPPIDMLEYASAKSAGESLCRGLSTAYPEITFLQPRIPRVETDQTKGVFQRKNADPIPIVLKYLRDLS